MSCNNRHCFNVLSHVLKCNKKYHTYHRKSEAGDIRVAIIGAGLAGISAASHLVNNGFRNTILLEATDRYGGRIISKRFGDAYCELGAKTISIDARRGSMYELLRKASGLKKQIEAKGDMVYVGKKGNKISQRIPTVVDILFKNICLNMQLDEKCKLSDVHHLKNVHSYFQTEAEKTIKFLFKEDQQLVAQEIFDSMFKEFGSTLGCCLECVNIEHITNIQKQPVDPIYLPTGMDNLLSIIAKDINECNIITGKPVGEITWYDSSNLNETKIGCLDGACYVADHVICTLPLGVLKIFSNSLFKPALPKQKLEAIQNLGYGTPVKIYFEYGSCVKPWFTTTIRPLWGTPEQQSQTRNWKQSIVEMSRLPTSNRVVEIKIGGSYYDEIERLPDLDLITEVTELLRLCFNNSNIPYPHSLLRSDWGSSACYLGGRPYFSTTSSKEDVAALAAPLGQKTPILQFAGDATSIHGFGGIDGARMSGIREAQRIIDHYKRDRKSA